MELPSAIARALLIATLMVALADANLNVVVPMVTATTVKNGSDLGCSLGYDCSCQDCTNHGYDYYCPSSSECYSTSVTCGGGCDGRCQHTGRGCTSCEDGENCNCVECAASGYDYFCPSDLECYSTEETCGLSCGGSCILTGQTATCQIATTCNTVQKSKCGANSTCCMSGTAPYAPFCTDFPATCCHVDTTYCPEKYSCNPPDNNCLLPNINPSTECKFCREVVSKLEGKGSSRACQAACDILPAGVDELCNLAMKYGLCSWIENKVFAHIGGNEICDMLGACSSGECACGYCTPDYFGQWCLSVPNHCPSSSIRTISTPTSEKKKSRDAFHAKAARSPKLSTTKYDRHMWFKELKWKLPVVVLQNLTEHHIIDALSRNVEGFCADGMCGAEYEGCCLTCAP